MIIATNGSRRRVFDDHLWKEMPPGKYGWKLAAEEPEEVKQLKALTKKPPKEPTTPDTPSIQELQIQIAEYEKQIASDGIHHMVRKSLEKKKAELEQQLKALTDAGNN